MSDYLDIAGHIMDSRLAEAMQVHDEIHSGEREALVQPFRAFATRADDQPGPPGTVAPGRAWFDDEHAWLHDTIRRLHEMLASQSLWDGAERRRSEGAPSQPDGTLEP
jgi:hypothetical protein